LTDSQHFVQTVIDIGLIIGILLVGGIVKFVRWFIKEWKKDNFIEDFHYKYGYDPHWWRAAPTEDQVDRWLERERNGDVAPSERRRLLRRKRIRKIFGLGRESKPEIHR